MFGWIKRKLQPSITAKELDEAMATIAPQPPVEDPKTTAWIGQPVTIATGQRRTDAHVRRWRGRKQRLKTIIARHRAKGEEIPAHLRHELIELNMQLGDPLDGVAD